MGPSTLPLARPSSIPTTAHRTHHPLDVRPRLRHSGRSQHFLNAKFLHLLGEARTEDSITVSQQETRCAVPGKCPAVAAQSIPQSDEPSRQNVESGDGRKDPVAHETLIDEYWASWNPATPVERDLVDILIRTNWVLRRPNRGPRQTVIPAVGRVWFSFRRISATASLECLAT
jgi:hypothetical protein